MFARIHLRVAAMNQLAEFFGAVGARAMRVCSSVAPDWSSALATGRPNVDAPRIRRVPRSSHAGPGASRRNAIFHPCGGRWVEWYAAITASIGAFDRQRSIVSCVSPAPVRDVRPDHRRGLPASRAPT